MIVVLANGCFDILHAEHVEHLQEARRLGDCLWVSLTRDEYVNKGPDRPINTWSERATCLRALRCVNWVFPSRTLADAIAEVSPDIVVKGSDYDGYQFGPHILDACAAVGARLVLTQSLKRSATETIVRVRELYVRNHSDKPSAQA